MAATHLGFAAWLTEVRRMAVQRTAIRIRELLRQIGEIEKAIQSVKSNKADDVLRPGDSIIWNKEIAILLCLHEDRAYIRRFGNEALGARCKEHNPRDDRSWVVTFSYIQKCRDANSLKSSLASLQRRLGRLVAMQKTNYPMSPTEEYLRIIHHPMVENALVQDGKLCVMTRRVDVKSVPIGRMEILLRKNKGGLVVSVHNRTRGIPHHPHVFRNGGICFGDAENEFSEMAKRGHVYFFLDALIHFLRYSYNPSSIAGASLEHYLGRDDEQSNDEHSNEEE